MFTLCPVERTVLLSTFNATDGLLDIDAFHIVLEVVDIESDSRKANGLACEPANTLQFEDLV